MSDTIYHRPINEILREAGFERAMSYDYTHYFNDTLGRVFTRGEAHLFSTDDDVLLLVKRVSNPLSTDYYGGLE